MPPFLFCHAPGNGWAKLRLSAKNPGVWIFHDHIHWHAHAGLISAFIEAPTDLVAKAKSGKIQINQEQLDNCAAYRNGV